MFPCSTAISLWPKWKTLSARAASPVSDLLQPVEFSQRILGFWREQEIGTDLQRIRIDYDFEDMCGGFRPPSEIARRFSMARVARPWEFSLIVDLYGSSRKSSKNWDFLAGRTADVLAKRISFSLANCEPSALRDIDLRDRRFQA